MWGISIRQSFYRKPTTLEYHSSIINLPSKTAGSKFRPWFIEPLIAPYYLVRSINYKNHFIFRIDNKTTWFSCLMICKKIWKFQSLSMFSKIYIDFNKAHSTSKIHLFNSRWYLCLVSSTNRRHHFKVSPNYFKEKPK